jgi:hypothetical protein
MGKSVFPVWDFVWEVLDGLVSIFIQIIGKNVIEKMTLSELRE